MSRDATLTEWRDAIHQYARDKGWWRLDPEGKSVLSRNFGEMLMLIVSEAAEALEEYRAGRNISETYYNEDDTKPEGIPSELADIIIRVLDLCGAYQIDIEAIMKEKHAYNLTREYRHGDKRA